MKTIWLVHERTRESLRLGLSTETTRGANRRVTAAKLSVTEAFSI